MVLENAPISSSSCVLPHFVLLQPPFLIVLFDLSSPTCMSLHPTVDGQSEDVCDELLFGMAAGSERREADG